MPLSVVQQFIRAINAHDVDAISACISHKHVMTDAHGDVVSGRDAVLQAWKMYFSIFPDYHVEINEIFGNNESVAIFGHASASFANGMGEKKSWRLPSAWRAMVQNNLVTAWHIYADTREPYDIITEASGTPKE